MEKVYLHKKHYIKKDHIDELYRLIDKNDDDSLSVNEFFELIDILDRNPKF